MNLKLSVFIIAFNEERILEDCLKKLYWVDEIIVVDSGSTDNTVTICEKYNAKVYYRKFDGFGEQKQFALNQTSNDWVLSLDADEVLTDSLIDEIKFNIETNPKDFAGYYIKCRMVFLGKTFNFGNESNRNILRLFNKTKGDFCLTSVHEEIIVKGKTKKLQGHYLHYSYASIQAFISKLNTYTQLGAANRFAKNKKYSFYSIIIKTIFEFVKKFLFELNILNGKSGFHWSLLSAFSTYVKCIKTNEYTK